MKHNSLKQILNILFHLCVEFSHLYVHPVMKHNSLKQILNILFHLFRAFNKELFGELLAKTYNKPTDTYHSTHDV